MLFKLSFSNMKKSLKDYAVYFFTLILGVAIFYLFNAIETQTTMLKISEDTDFRPRYSKHCSRPER